ncbi:MAG: DoxX family membrane protein [Flavobacteriaceae bacterium]|nr:DoxX family membrane protein [Flavobacteriaceae bacterium]
MTKTTNFIIRIIIAILLLQTLYFKFTAHPDSVYIFSKIGMEPYGRVGTGIMELIVSFLILLNRTQWLGALLALGLMFGAMFFHVTKLGIEVNNDGGLLFGMAVFIFVLSLVVLWINRTNIPIIKKNR